jgi:hypothetical protein
MKKIELIEEQQRKKRYKLLSSVIIGITILLSMLQLILANTLASYGNDLARYSVEEKDLTLQNEILMKQISQFTSLQTIASKAAELSLKTPEGYLVVKADESVAFAQ